jgi:hypothetical protein
LNQIKQELSMGRGDSGLYKWRCSSLRRFY